MKTLFLVLLAFVLLISSGPKAFAQNQPKIVVVSDIDDTIRLTRIHPLGHYFDFFVGLFKQRAFAGMPLLYNYLNSKGVAFEYVSGTPLIYRFFPEKFLQMAGFPVGKLYDRTNEQITIEDYKYQEISELMRANPESQFILIGDNGQRDVATYRRLQENPEFARQIKSVYIHKIYSGDVAMELAKDQKPFFTAADLALQLSQQQLVNEGELSTVFRTVDQGLDSEFDEVQKRAQPDFMLLSPSDFNKLKKLSQEMPKSDNLSVFQRIIEKLRPSKVIFCSEVF